MSGVRQGPSSFYRADLWRLGVALGPRLASWGGGWLGRALADLYWLCARHRRSVVIENLRPVLNDDAGRARAASRALFRQFALKLVDLWRFESGHPVDPLFAGLQGFERLQAAHAEGRGAVLLTMHVGNWELGGPMLVRQGIKLQVLTQAEPGRDFTALRQASRERWGIETRVVGSTWYDFVGLIKDLSAGATVALLLDRPRASAAATVRLFGRDFSASLAPAELARASGCALFPVYIIHTPRGYEAHILPEVAYDRSALGHRRERVALTQTMVGAFEPVIRAHPDQWYHFVPIWPGPIPPGSTEPPAPAHAGAGVP